MISLLLIGGDVAPESYMMQ